MISKEQLLKARLPEQEVLVDGGSLRIRGLSRAEAARLARFKADPDAGEVWLLTVAIVDPQLSEDEVRTWMQSAPNDEVTAVLDAVFEISGLKEAALKAAAKRFRNESGAEPGVPSGPNAGDDGSPSAG